MKRNFLALLLMSAILLTSCSKDIPPSSELTANNTPSTPQTTMSKTDNTAYDYSDHTDSMESNYTTVLADTSAIKGGKPVIAQKEIPANWSWMTFRGFDVMDEIYDFDMRSCDISKEDLSVVKDINKLSFDTDTTWPQLLPDGFDPKKILEDNMNPGLGIRDLHEKGITGQGVSIAIIDQALLLEHEQYAENICFYERIHCNDKTAQMHGPAVSSIAVGKDIGVAPKAKLYYIATTYGHYTLTEFELDASIIADEILRVLEINKELPIEGKIRVISISRGYTRQDKGYTELQAAIQKADKENVFVITTTTDEYYKDFSLFGMDRDYDKDPEKISSYVPISWVTEDFYNHPDQYKDYLLFPIGSRTIASPTNPDDYAISRNGGLSWSVPWCAGFYALCCQVKPDITPQEFIEIANSTAVTTEIEHNGKTYSFGKIINPAGVIEQLQNQ